MLPDPERLDETEDARMKAKRVACLAAGLLAMAGLVDAQDKVPSVYVDGKVANFALPGHDYSSPGFESLSFWSGPHGKAIDRSEEHTSERQLLMRISYAVFCLKNKRKKQPAVHIIIMHIITTYIHHR